MKSFRILFKIKKNNNLSNYKFNTIIKLIKIKYNWKPLIIYKNNLML